MRWLGILLLTGLLAACGGGSTDESDDLPDTVQELTTTTAPEGLALADWQAAAGAACLKYTPILQATVDQHGQPATQEEAVALLDAILFVYGEYGAAMHAIPVPTERTRQVNELLDRVDRGTRALAAARDSAVRGSPSDLTSAVLRLDSYANTNELFLELGVPECADEA